MGPIKSIYELLSIVEGIEGWLSPCEQIALLHLPSMVDHLSGSIVEIGSYKGKSTTALALGSSLLSTKKRPIYAIDPFVVPPYDFFEDNIKKHGLGEFVIPIKKHSFEAYDDCPESISAIFIDGDHEYASIKHDIIHYVPRVLVGGLIAFHDYSEYWPGVIKAVNELCKKNEFEFVTIYDNLLFIRKL
ncbi:MAG: SAM-dependent methyltransferase [Firmicutes bacterium]|jgi:predicted O-methyltransferase YrrM|nr:SAM-dependent methyltransferase [Bacillota bacterium]